MSTEGLIEMIPCHGGPLDGKAVGYYGNTSFNYATDQDYSHDGKNVHTYTLEGSPNRFTHRGKNLECHCDKCQELNPK